MKSYKLCDVYVCKNIIKKMITICTDKSGNKDIFFTRWFIDVYYMLTCIKISVEWKRYVLHDLMANI